jgi:hypothetical protein
MLAAPFASLSNTLCAPNNPKAKTVTLGLAPAGIHAEAKKTIGARSPAATILMSLLNIMAVLPDRNEGEITKSCTKRPLAALGRLVRNVDAGTVHRHRIHRPWHP